MAEMPVASLDADAFANTATSTGSLATSKRGSNVRCAVDENVSAEM